ncbi:hypothetical protein GWO43_15895 [candidate division KSB1 bacterium]|nr:hypothetical protein [candidate division KSB1 bacterium]NIR68596.1 hypothetical protein [candidate division KSB1 bacterium]NIS25433.1 hypothetical protein [candidate division KSB1 bacterium]NIT72325.1 hypothetical protein [candidate division KSB1 bacterium]NIU26109.1 hypothetical protein [candidate division KSB1 bacterium]
MKKKGKRKRKKEKKTRPKIVHKRKIEHRDPIDYYWDLIREADEDYFILHPNNSLNVRQKVQTLCKQSASTQLVYVLERLYQRSDDVISRSMLAKKTVMLQRGYLESHKEYSDRALIRLTEREKLFDKWEGFYILGCFGGEKSISYLEEQLEKENNQLLKQTIKRSIHKIKANIQKKIEERGF